MCATLLHGSVEDNSGFFNFAYIDSLPQCILLLCHMLSASLLFVEQKGNKNIQHGFRGRLTYQTVVFSN